MTLLVYLMIGAVLSGLAAGELVKKWSAPTDWDAPSQLAEGSSPGSTQGGDKHPKLIERVVCVQIAEARKEPKHSINLSLAKEKQQFFAVGSTQ